MALKIGVMSPQPRNAGSLQRPGEAGNALSPEPLEGVLPGRHLDFSLVILTSDFWLPELGGN